MESGEIQLCVKLPRIPFIKDVEIYASPQGTKRLLETSKVGISVKFDVQLQENYGPVRTVSQGKGGLVLIGTTKNCILQGSLDLEFSPIMQVRKIV